MRESFVYSTVPFGHLTSPLLSAAGAKHIFTAKDGGVSEGAFASFNFAAGGGEVCDRWENVVENHTMVAHFFGMEADRICRSYQTHSTKVLTVTAAHCGTGLTLPPFEEGVDGLVCAEEGVLLSVRGADCVTVLLYDGGSRVCGACHSGWRGTLGGIAALTVEAMCAAGASRDSIVAAIGPSARSCCYRVGEELYCTFTDADVKNAAFFTHRNGELYLDLQGAVSAALTEAGVKDGHISDGGECSICRPDRYFSHRRQGPVRGTMAAFITL
ncbi:MAG: peptidoglycan editing factor PgeF [Clostridia bacterium]|nr:peptidoglycan editing factor PgeF [Clostridia bacterium]